MDYAGFKSAVLGCTFLMSCFSSLLWANTDNIVKFSIAQIPDTQSYFSHPGSSDPEQITDMYQWIINDHDPNNPTKNNYQYIFHVGDIIEQGGLIGVANPETDWEWGEAQTIFSNIEQTMSNKFIPNGFAIGNHDPRNAHSKDPYGNGDFKPETTLESYAFLKSRNSLAQNPHGFIEDPQKKFTSPNYFVSYHQFQIENVKFIAVNIPFNLSAQAPAVASAVNQFINDNKNSLIILNSHVCDQGRAIAAGNKNVFMLVCGHDSSPVYPDGKYQLIPGTTIPNGNTPAYSYRFDYQSGGKDNLPQHPLIRTYDFALDTEEGVLSWTVNDVQPWVIHDFNTKGVRFGYKPNAFGWAQNAQFAVNKSKLEQVQINYNDYLSAQSICTAPTLPIEPAIGCNAKTGSNVKICWDAALNAKAYYIEKSDYTSLLPKKGTTTQLNATDANVGPSSYYIYYVYSVCTDGTKSSALKITAK
jgi:hypothetical protein